VYGLPTPAACEAANEGLLVLAGCLMPEDPDRWQCANSHAWKGVDEALPDAFLRAALQGRPRCPACGGPSIAHIYPGTIGEELWADEIATGEVVVAAEAGPPGVNWDQLCLSCRHVWSPR
jgi:hypothetical protein